MEVTKICFSLVVGFIILSLTACTIPYREKYTYKAVKETDPKIATVTSFRWGYLKLYINQNYDKSNNNCKDYKVTETVTGLPGAAVTTTVSLEPNKPTSIMIAYTRHCDEYNNCSPAFFGHYFFIPKENEKYIFTFKANDNARKITQSFEVENDQQATEKIIKFDHGNYYWQNCKGTVIDDKYYK